MSGTLGIREMDEMGYQLTKLIREGGSSSIWLAQKSGSNVVVKQFKHSVVDPTADIWKRELQLLQQLEHPQIPKYLDFYVEQVGGRSLPHIVMEWVDGESLADVLKKQRFKKEEVRSIVEEILKLVGHLHQLRPAIIHRDIKLDNIIRRHDGVLFLVDFGLAVDDVLQTMGRTLLAGTLGYRAPEQQVGQPTTRSDLYSIGVCALELLVGTPPSKMLQPDGLSLRLEWRHKIPETSAIWNKWLEQMLAEDPKRRFSSAEMAKKALPLVADEAFLTSVSEQQSAFQAAQLMQQAAALGRQSRPPVGTLSSEQRAYLHKVNKEKKHQRSVSLDRQRVLQAEVFQEQEQVLRSKIEESWDQLIAVAQRDPSTLDQQLRAFLQAYQPLLSLNHQGVVHCVDSPYIAIAGWKLGECRCDLRRYLRSLSQRFAPRLKVRSQTLKQELEQVRQQLERLSFWEGLFRKKELQLMEQELLMRQQQLAAEKEELWAQMAPYVQLFGMTQNDLEQDGLTLLNVQTYALDDVRWSETFVPEGMLTMRSYKRRNQALIPFQVRITAPFYMVQTPITQQFWSKVMPHNPSHVQRAAHPVDSICWLDALIFCNKLSELQQLEPVYRIPVELQRANITDEQLNRLSKSIRAQWSNSGYRLPTEAEWELAAKGGENHTFAGASAVEEVAWCADTVPQDRPGSQPVGVKKPNGYGLYDMSGNIWEWCWDLRGTDEEEDLIKLGVVVDPRGAEDGNSRVLRGGSWFDAPELCKVDFRRNTGSPSFRFQSVGLRPIRNAQ